MEVLPFDGADAFVDYLRPSRDHWFSRGDSVQTRWLFRGHADDQWPLRPSAWRSANSPVFESIAALSRRLVFDVVYGDFNRPPAFFNPEAKPGTLLDVFSQAASEWQLVREFVELADSMGFRIPFGNIPQLSDMVRMYEGGYWTDIYSEPTAAVTLAQHHGVPTRLLDFTWNPLVAAFFAADGALSRGGDNSENLCVWALRSDSLPAKVVRRFTPAMSENSFLQAQAGVFLWVKAAEEFYATNARWPDIDELIPGSTLTGDRAAVRKVVLRASEAPAVLRLLWRERVSRVHLMPTLDNITRALNAKWRHGNPALSGFSSEDAKEFRNRLLSDEPPDLRFVW